MDVLYNILQSSKSNNITTKEAFNKFESSINLIQNRIPDFIPGSEIIKRHNTADELLIRDAKEACDKIISEITDRFNSFEIFKSFVIVDPTHFNINRQS